MLARGTGFGELSSLGFRPFPQSPILPDTVRFSSSPFPFCSLYKALGGSLPQPSSFTHQNKKSFLFRSQKFGLTDYFS